MIVLIFQLAVEVEPDSTKLEPEINTVNASPEVLPKSVVVVSVKLTEVPDHKAIMFPARAFEPDLAT